MDSSVARSNSPFALPRPIRWKEIFGIAQAKTLDKPVCRIFGIRSRRFISFDGFRVNRTRPTSRFTSSFGPCSISRCSSNLARRLISIWLNWWFCLSGHIWKWVISINNNNHCHTLCFPRSFQSIWSIFIFFYSRSFCCSWSFRSSSTSRSWLSLKIPGKISRL